MPTVRSDGDITRPVVNQKRVHKPEALRIEEWLDRGHHGVELYTVDGDGLAECRQICGNLVRCARPAGQVAVEQGDGDHVPVERAVMPPVDEGADPDPATGIVGSRTDMLPAVQEYRRASVLIGVEHRLRVTLRHPRVPGWGFAAMSSTADV